MIGAAQQAARVVVGVLAQAGPAERNAPIRTIIQQNRDAGVEPLHRVELPLGLLGVMLGVALAASALAWWINSHARHRPPAERRAFLRLARGHGLGRRSRRLVENLGAEVGMAPVALLASPGVLRAAIADVDQVRWAQRPGWERLAQTARRDGRE